MSQIDTQDFKKGTWIEVDGEPWMVIDVHKHAPTARGGKTLVQTKLRNLLDQRVLTKSFKSGEMFQIPDLRRRVVSFLYKAGEVGSPPTLARADARSGSVAFAFMDKDSYDQFELQLDQMGGNEVYLIDGLELEAVYYNDKLVGVEPPQFVEMEVVSVEPGTRGDTSGKVTTPATTQSGLVLPVPLFIKAGDRIRVNTRTGEFQDRLR